MKRVKSFEQFITEAKKSKVKFFIDMDGVLADFDDSVRNSVSGAKHIEQLSEIRKWMKENLPDFEWKILHDLNEIREEYPELNKLYKEATDLIKTEAKKKGFFENLKIMNGAREILEAAKEISGDLPNILTACVDSEHCEPEKIVWMKKHFKGLYDEFICEQQKEKYATGKTDVLVDDRSFNIKDFVEAGGSGILHDPEDVEKTLREMKKFA